MTNNNEEFTLDGEKEFKLLPNTSKDIIGEKYNVIFAETTDGKLESERMTLIEKKVYKGKEIYTYEDSMGYKVVSYNHGDEIDWDYMEEINDLI